MIENEQENGKMTISEKEIAKWTGVIERQGDKGRLRMRSYICSRVLGRDFLEPVDEYFERKGLTAFIEWSRTV